ncbi:MAG: hypothetical protein OXT71_15470 [Acidobacteriota bacterium]|nr:hypothetical protein [Acidobacteriota bacterium]
MTASILAQDDDLYDEFEDEDDTDDFEDIDDYAGLNDTNLNGDGVRADAGT